MFHGWKVVGCAFLIAVFGWGLGFYGVGVFLQALAALHGWPTALVSSAITVYYLLGATLILGMTTAFERWGPRRVVLAGVAAMATGSLTLTMLTAPWQLYPTFALLAVGWACMSGAALNLIVAPWFERRRGLAISIAFNGASAGGVLVAPALLLTIDRLGFSAGVAVVCGAMGVLVVPPALAWLHRGPAVLGLAPDGLGAPAPAPGAPLVAGVVPPPARWAFMRSWHFWSLALPFALGLMVQVGVLTHQVPLLRGSLGLAGVGLAVSLTTAAAIVGRLVVGTFVDRVPRRAVAAGSFLLQTVALGLLLRGGGPGLLVGACALYGLGVGNMTSLPSLIVQVEFPKAAFGRIVSTVVAVNQYTFSLGPLLLGALRDWSGTYRPALLACMAVMLLATGLLLSWRAPAGDAAPASRGDTAGTG